MINKQKDIIIDIKNLVKKFGNFTANNNISFQVYKGEIFGFLGANGAGKTTALRILCGLSQPTSGKITIAGFDIYKNTEAIKKNIGYMSQRFSLYENLTVYENIRFFAGIYGLSKQYIQQKSEQLLTDLNIINLRNKLISSLPLGWKQKLAFSIAVFHNPKIVFLDEPTSGVDPITRRQFWNMIYEATNNGITVFITTHYMDEAEYCHRVAIMNEGCLKAIGSPIELKQNFNATTMNEVFIKIARK